ncbi:hypothetical protein AVEN_13086-1 [Araneus ventricosus]|uniref:Uncharacterized protein n=1 Tax=Araneus ventricosus TaxID=182803 RepID=A0A4Y2LKM8_ARAVE|nr:hypothetical protein AVEN_13086-1 [Araneus ventricosus]
MYVKEESNKSSSEVKARGVFTPNPPFVQFHSYVHPTITICNGHLSSLFYDKDEPSKCALLCYRLRKLAEIKGKIVQKNLMPVWDEYRAVLQGRNS